jgi:hypothetical protein
MKYTSEIWEQEQISIGDTPIITKCYGWSIYDYVGDEIASSTLTFPSRKEAQEELYAALEDWNWIGGHYEES